MVMNEIMSNLMLILSKIKFPEPLVKDNYLILDKIQVKLFSNFTNILFDLSY